MESKITVNDEEIPWKQGLTVNEVLKLMNYTFRRIVVKVNGTVVKKDSYSTFEIPRDADVKVIHLIAGG